MVNTEEIGEVVGQTRSNFLAWPSWEGEPLSEMLGLVLTLAHLSLGGASSEWLTVAPPKM